MNLTRDPSIPRPTDETDGLASSIAFLGISPGDSTSERWPQDLARAKRQDDTLSLCRVGALNFDKMIRTRIQDMFGKD